MRIRAPRFPQTITLAVVVTLGWSVACSDTPGGTDCCDTLPQGLIISDPVPATGVAQGSPVASALTTSAADEVTFVSLPPGTVPTGATATILRVGDRPLSTAVFDGGFDPVPVVAQAGDSIDVIVRDAAGGAVLQVRLAVAAARPPVVIRTDPPRRKTDVPVNAAIVIVFSEPVDAGTLTPSSVRLFHGTDAVAGTITLLQGTGALAAFVPNAPLSANTEYRLELTPAVQDLDGDALQAGVTATFTTGQSSTGPAASLQLSPLDFSLAVGQTYQMTATVRDALGTILIDQPVTWSSGRQSISSTGLVTAVSLGPDSVHATLGGLRSAASVDVIEPSHLSVEVSPVAATVAVGDTIILTATVRDGAGPILGTSPVWTSSAPELATVETDTTRTGGYYGMVKGLSAGSVTITATSGAVRGSAAVTVGPTLPVTSVTVVPDSTTIVVQGTVRLTATLRDATGRAIGGPITWVSQNPAVATVDANGLVTGVETGSAVVSATSGGVSGFATITATMIEFASVHAACGLSTSGAAYCWGDNYFGQLGNGSTTHSAVPVAVIGGLTFTTVTASGSHTCGLTTTGAAYCWGYNAYGQLGNGSTTHSPVPVPVVGGLTFMTVIVGGINTCAVTTTGAAYCWGHNGHGQLGNSSTTHSAVPVAVIGGLTFTTVTASGSHTCGVTTTGAAYCWGYNNYGELGNGSTTSSAVPVAVIGGLTFTTLTAGGGSQTCGLTTTGAAYCWGYNGEGQLGNGSTTHSAVPVAVIDGLTFTTLTVGGVHACGVTTTEAAYCWGRNNSGQLGNGSTTSSAVPVAVIGGLTFTTVTAGQNYACGLATTGAAYCWGYNGAGWLGDGTFSSSTVPVKVAGQP